MGILYKESEEVVYEVEITQKDGNINLLFSNDGGKFGTDEILDEYDLTPLQLLEILQASNYED